MQNRIISLEIQNFMRISAFYYEPKKPVVKIGGLNEQGKSSVIKALLTLLGRAELPEVPVHRGADKALIVLKTPDYTIRETITVDGKSELVITNPEGDQKYGSPQTLFNSVVGRLGFRPKKFFDLGEDAAGRKKQVEMLRELIGLDTTAIDRERKALYDERALAGRDVTGRQTQIDALPEYPDAPPVEVDVAAITAEIQKANAETAKCNGVVQAATLAKERYAAAERESLRASECVDEILQDSKNHIAAAKKAVKAAQDALAQAEYDGAARDDAAMKRARGADRERLEAAAVSDVADGFVVKLIFPDTAPLQAKIAAAETTNLQVRANATRAKMVRQFQEAKDQYAELDKQIEALDAKRKALIASAKFPVDGLGLGEDYVTYKGLPLNQASSAEAWRVCIAIAAAMSKGLKLILVEDASLLDENHMAVIEEMAEELDLLVILETVSQGEECEVILTDGRVMTDAERAALKVKA